MFNPCILCDSTRPTTAHILGGYPMALTQQRYTYHHDQVLLLLATKLKEMLKANKFICVYADFHGWRSSESPQATIPLALVSIYPLDQV